MSYSDTLAGLCSEGYQPSDAKRMAGAGIRPRPVRGAVLLSDCCRSRPWLEAMDNEGICSACKEHATFSEDEA